MEAKYDRWTLLGPGTPQGYRRTWRCRCECGREKEVLEQNLLCSRSKSCGCLSRDKVFTGYEEILGVYWTRLKIESKRRRKLDFKISIQFAWQLFLLQDRRCALTGLSIKFAKSAKEYWARENTASLDRIDSNLGYIPENVQWVHKDVNKMKQNFSEVRLLELCKLIVEHNHHLAGVT